MDTMATTYDVDRKTASRLLKMSVRTVDRYIRANKLSSQSIDGRIWLSKKEILGLRNVVRVDSVDIGVDTVDSKKSIDSRVDRSVDMSIDGVEVVSTPRIFKSGKGRERDYENIYKKLYEEQKEELRVKQERLEGANYRVGQLEALLKETVPLPEHQKLLSSETAARLELEEGIESLREKLQSTAKKMNEEMIIKKIYVAVLFIIMALQPLWLIFGNN